MDPQSVPVEPHKEERFDNLWKHECRNSQGKLTLRITVEVFDQSAAASSKNVIAAAQSLLAPAQEQVNG